MHTRRPGAGMQMSETCVMPGSDGVPRPLVDVAHEAERRSPADSARRRRVDSGFPGPMDWFVAIVGVDGLLQAEST